MAFISRISGDLGEYGYYGKGPVWWYPREKMYSTDNEPTDEELEKLKQRLNVELDRLFYEK